MEPEYQEIDKNGKQIRDERIHYLLLQEFSHFFDENLATHDLPFTNL